MNSSSLIVSITNIEDIKKITAYTKYINIDITNPDDKVITYFLDHGQNYKYADLTEDVLGYNYASYDNFLEGENIIELILSSMPHNLNELEKARYIYLAIGKRLSFDINTDTSKNEIYNLSLISGINNIWGSLSMGCVNDITASKIYYYICRRLGLNISLLIEENNKTALNKIVIDNQVLVVDLFEDIPYIWANMHTRHFATYNSDTVLDKKIKYIKDKYLDYYLDRELKHIDYTKDDCIFTILNKLKNLIDVNHIKPTELSIIYKYIFNTYCANYNIKINNLFLKNNLKKHFLLISFNDSHYSYNYQKKSFVEVSTKDLIDNINLGKIGIYLNELIPNINN